MASFFKEIKSDLDLGTLDWIWTILLCCPVKYKPFRQASIRDLF